MYSFTIKYSTLSSELLKIFTISIIKDSLLLVLFLTRDRGLFVYFKYKMKDE